MNEKAEFAVQVLKQYALENQIPARSTSDLSPMEHWLILRLLAVSQLVCEHQKIEHIDNISDRMECVNCGKRF